MMRHDMTLTSRLHFCKQDSALAPLDDLLVILHQNVLRKSAICQSETEHHRPGAKFSIANLTEM